MRAMGYRAKPIPNPPISAWKRWKIPLTVQPKLALMLFEYEAVAPLAPLDWIWKKLAVLPVEGSTKDPIRMDVPEAPTPSPLTSDPCDSPITSRLARPISDRNPGWVSTGSLASRAPDAERVHKNRPVDLNQLLIVGFGRDISSTICNCGLAKLLTCEQYI